MNAILQSPSAMILLLALLAVVVLQISGDVIETLARRRTPKYKPHATYYIPKDTMASALRTSNQQLRNYRQRITSPYGPTKTTQAPRKPLRPNLTTIVIALMMTSLVFATEGFVIALGFMMMCIALMSVVGLLAWHPSKKLSTYDKLAIALLAPFALLVT